VSVYSRRKTPVKHFLPDAGSLSNPSTAHPELSTSVVADKGSTY